MIEPKTMLLNHFWILAQCLPFKWIYFCSLWFSLLLLSMLLYTIRCVRVSGKLHWFLAQIYLANVRRIRPIKCYVCLVFVGENGLILLHLICLLSFFGVYDHQVHFNWMIRTGIQNTHLMIVCCLPCGFNYMAVGMTFCQHARHIIQMIFRFYLVCFGPVLNCKSYKLIIEIHTKMQSNHGMIDEEKRDDLLLLWST